MIIFTHTSEPRLPMSVRSYIDGCASEFNKADEWTKIADIAYRLKRGINLLPAFIEDINRLPLGSARPRRSSAPLRQGECKCLLP